MSDRIVVTFNAGSSSLRCGVYHVRETGSEPFLSLSIRGLPRRMILQTMDHIKNTSDETEIDEPGVNERSKLTRFQRLNLTHPLWRKGPRRAALI